MVDSIDEQLARDEAQSPFDANDPAAIAELEKLAASIKSKKLRVVEAVMSNEDGRAWMHELCADCYTFTENLMRETDGVNGRVEGKRSIGLNLFNQIMDAAPEMWWKMVCEARERK